ncbi:hypothetical protein PF010_g25049 [Phytophthora fragariae]|uniref:Uncharacterized protein n=2 Tax=Phytophthora fragariae TaxID=53985 RepID=A0A6G0K1R2_9STRA|nr:hypothetical protein PF010_g25049 [Phytophthora fragariae]KAE9183613.1 hypothetical protein PF004_g23901 [Phytophthora fragariae]
MNVSDSETSSVCGDDLLLMSDTSDYDAEVNSPTTSSDGDDVLDDGPADSSPDDTLEYELVSQLSLRSTRSNRETIYSCTTPGHASAPFACMSASPIDRAPCVFALWQMATNSDSNAPVRTVMEKYDDNPEMLRKLPTATQIKSRDNYLRNKAENGWFVRTFAKLFEWARNKPGVWLLIYLASALSLTVPAPTWVPSCIETRNSGTSSSCCGVSTSKIIRRDSHNLGSAWSSLQGHSFGTSFTPTALKQKMAF